LLFFLFPHLIVSSNSSQTYIMLHSYQFLLHPSSIYM
jgi:hypothetical protein